MQAALARGIILVSRKEGLSFTGHDGYKWPSRARNMQKLEVIVSDSGRCGGGGGGWAEVKLSYSWSSTCFGQHDDATTLCN